MKKQRVTFYIDGFNFYYGLKRKQSVSPIWKQFYWIDLVKLCSQFLGVNQELVKVIYFTASPLDKNKNSRQSAFLNANMLLNPNIFEVIRGKYINKNIVCPQCKYAINKPEEKKTDVNLSVRMLGDCFLDKTDVLILISADTDLIPPIDFIFNHFMDKKVKVYFPPSNYSYDMSNFIKAHNNKIIKMEDSKNKFINSIMPNIVKKEDKEYKIPNEWII